MPRTIAVTGGSGLLGRYVAEDLHRRDVNVAVLTRAAVTSAQAHHSTNYDVASLRRIFNDLRVDGVIHLAASRSGARDVEAHGPSLRAAQNVFEAAAESGVTDVGFASTIGVYDRQAPLPWAETARIAPLSTYGVLKYAAELLIPQYPSLNVRVLRLGHLFGAHEDNDYMVNRFMRLARSGEKITVNAAESNARDFVYARDAAVGVTQALLNDVSGVFNLGSMRPQTTLEIANAVIDGFKSSSSIEQIEQDHPSVASSWMDSSKARLAFGYEPRYTPTQAFAEIRDH